ncbi:MAG: Hsp70 family protein, partial [Proteobacteria bacterium]|nr:Hsp70 family protein [Pseudomonadota bacterium]
TSPGTGGALDSVLPWCQNSPRVDSGLAFAGFPPFTENDHPELAHFRRQGKLMKFLEGQTVGIDLGTTFSAICYLDDVGRPQLLTNMEGDQTTPSVVLIDGEDIVVGQEAVKAMGGTNLDVAMSVVLPSAMPSFISDALFATEKAVRASVILGLVGAGGIGIELKVAMDLFQYEKAALIILMIFVLVVCVEQVSNRLRAAVIGGH